VTLVKVVGQLRMNITSDDPANEPSKFCPAVDGTSVAVAGVKLAAPHWRAERN
jgi:hypothetical protein